MQNLVQADNNFTVYYLSEQAVTLEFGYSIQENTLQRIRVFTALLNAHPFPGFYTAVPAYTTVSVFYNLPEVMKADALPGKTGFEKVCNYVYQLKNKAASGISISKETVDIPVCYGGTYGPDLDHVARIHGVTPQEVVRQHSSAVYTVYMLGFVPGFAYLGGLPEQLATPRKETPRQKVPAGSVGIAGVQTGVYPFEIPGGWQLIGQTPLQLFNAARQQPALLKAGDRVKFIPITIEEFKQHQS